MKEKKEKTGRGKSKLQETILEGRGSKKPKFGLSSLKSQIEHKVNAKKILSFIKNSTKTIPHLLTKQQSKLLLPKLQKIALGKQQDTDPKLTGHFTEAEENLTQSMVQFSKKPELDNDELFMIEAQTKKCYKSIPEFYFNPNLTTEEIGRNLKLTKKAHQMSENVYELMDHCDEVEFNINQQVGAKIKIFTNFVQCMDSLQYMVVMNTRKIGQARAHTSLLRDIVVSRSIRINQNRLKKQRIQAILEVMVEIKKMKQLQAKLYHIIETGNVISHDPKTKSGQLYGDYCGIHNNVILKICCRGGRGLCKYWDLAYFVERGFQDNFMKMLHNYIFEVISISNDQQHYKRAFSINKKIFSTTPANGVNISSSFSNSFALDDSYEMDCIEEVELLVKENVEKQICKVFTLGMEHYTFSTDALAEELRRYLNKYVDEFLKDVLSEIDSQATISLKDVIVSPQKSKRQEQERFLGCQKFVSSLQKISWSKYEKIIEIVSARFQHLNVRIMSIVNKLISKAGDLQKEQNDRYQVICTYMIQLPLLVLSQTDNMLSQLVKARLREGTESKSVFKSKGDSIREFDLETQNMKKTIMHCKKWQHHISFLKSNYPSAAKEIQENASQTRGNLKWDYWSPLMFVLKGELVRSTYQNLHKSIITRQLKLNLEEDSWQIIEVDHKIYEILGYIMGGDKFVSEQEQQNRDTLSKSLLLQKNVSGKDCEPNQKNSYNKGVYSSKFKVNPMYVTIGTFRFKLTSSTEEMIRFLKHYLQLYDEASHEDSDQKYELHARITEVILMYNQYVKDLILKSESLKLGKINAKAIGAKHLVIAFVQLQVVDMIFCGEVMQARIEISPEECAVMHSKLTSTKNEIKSKFMKILEMRIMITIESLNYKEDAILKSDGLASIPKNIRSSVELFEDFMLEQPEMVGFLNMSNMWVAEIATKLHKGKSGERKMKVVSYLVTELSPFFQYMPIVKSALLSITS